MIESPADQLRVQHETRARQRWALRRDVVLAILGWFIITAIIIWAASHIAHALLLLIVAALLAYALAPAVAFLARFIPRWLALLLVYLAFVSVIGGLIYLIVNTAAAQISGLTHQISLLLSSSTTNADSPIITRLQSLGVPRSAIDSVGNTLLGQAQNVASSVLPVLTGVFSAVLDIILVTVLSIYLLIDGQRVAQMLRVGVPLRQRPRVGFLLSTLERVVGGYIRGQLLLSTLIGLLVGIGMTLLHVPYGVLLGVIAFILEFIPIIGVFVSGAACVLIALTQSWILAVIVLVYFIVVHIIEGDVVGPRIVGRAVGVHPAVSIFALIAGGELFGIWGALFASPIAGIIQAILTEIWREWRETHANQFPERFGAAVPATTSQAVNRVAAAAASGAAAGAQAATQVASAILSDERLDTGATRASTITPTPTTSSSASPSGAPPAQRPHPTPPLATSTTPDITEGDQPTQSVESRRPTPTT